MARNGLGERSDKPVMDCRHATLSEMWARAHGETYQQEQAETMRKWEELKRAAIENHDFEVKALEQHVQRQEQLNMSKPKRTDEQLIADTFADLPVERQETQLLVLQSIYRQNQRQQKRAAAAPAKAPEPAAQDTLRLQEPAGCPHGVAAGRPGCPQCLQEDLRQ